MEKKFAKTETVDAYKEKLSTVYKRLSQHSPESLYDALTTESICSSVQNLNTPCLSSVVWCQCVYSEITVSVGVERLNAD